jgi:hypothetical protein
MISADHLIERQVCAVIDDLAGAVWLDRQAALGVLRFLDGALIVHLRDTADDLFPLLAERCTAEDSIAGTLARIGADRTEILHLLPGVRAALAGCLAAGAELPPDARTLLLRFTAHLRRHLVAENAILLPIARVRLTQADLVRLAAGLGARRGHTPLPGGTTC